jgi:acyl carrier protein
VELKISLVRHACAAQVEKRNFVWPGWTPAAVFDYYSGHMGLDALELVLGWEEAFDISISDEEAALIRTPRMAIDLIATKLGAADLPRRPCLTQRAFYRLRTSMMRAGAVSRQRVRPETPVKELLNRSNWNSVRTSCGIPSLPWPGLFSPRTVAGLAHWTTAHAARHLKAPGEPWSRAEIRTVVRAVVTDVTSVQRFGDDDDFFHVIGVG